MIAAPHVLTTAQEPVLVDELTWREFKAVEQLIDRPGIRLSFLDGVLEIQTMPGRMHETAKGRMGALLELYMMTAGIDFTPTESLTLESESGRVKREADKSYELNASSNQPDLAIEIVVTSGGIDKLLAYQRLQIPEVWFWEKGKLSLYALRSDCYQSIRQSEHLPALDIALLEQRMNIQNHVEALKSFQTGLLTSKPCEPT
jgi:Uma2 family endonuclease